MDKKLEVTKVIDQWGWSYCFLGMEQKKYSRHNITLQKSQDVCFDSIDLLYIHSPDISPYTKDTLPLLAKERNIPLIGGYGGQMGHLWPDCVDAIVTISPQMLNFVKNANQKKPVLFLPECVDDSYFVPDKIEHEGFVVGFAGRPSAVKRPEILDALKYPVVRQSEWGFEYFVEDRTLEPMRKFYNSIDVLVLVSKTEAMPRVVMEAMACGIPVVSTNVGSIRMMLDSDWVVDTFPSEGVISQVNVRLDLLKNDPGLRLEVGKRNRKRIEEYLSWKINAPVWDDVFDAIYKKDYTKAEKVSEDVFNRLVS
jgi:glycosyltransferase involved in cell wall biosynthesis